MERFDPSPHIQNSRGYSTYSDIGHHFTTRKSTRFGCRLPMENHGAQVPCRL
jgi:hypothetical protein